MSVLTNFISQMNDKYSQANPIDLAKNIFKEGINLDNAIVSVLSSTGIAGFKFNVPKQEQIKMESEITDHYLDDNSVVQDHIIKRPLTITLNGLQGEYFYSVNELSDTIAKIVPTLKLVNQFLPKLSAATMQAKNNWAKYQKQAKLNTDSSLYSKGQLLWNTLNGLDLFQLYQNLIKLKSAQTRAFLFFEALWNSGAEFTVETSWKRYDNMVIQSLTPLRDNNADITDFTITFKQIRKTASLSRRLDASGRVVEQSAPTSNKGVDKGKSVEAIK